MARLAECSRTLLDAILAALVITLFVSVVGPRVAMAQCPQGPIHGPAAVADTGCDGAVSVTPHGGNLGTVTADSGNYVTTSFTVKNIGAESDSFWVTCSNDVAHTACVGVSGGTPIWLRVGQSTNITVTYSAIAPGVGTIGLSVWGLTHGGSDLGWDTVTVVAHPRPPVVDVTPYNPDDQDFGRCANACFAATASFSTVPYFSLGQAHAITLAYNGDRQDLRPFVFAKVYAPRGSSLTPAQFWFQVRLKVGGSWVTRTLINGDTTLHYNGSADTVRLGAQLADSDVTTGVDSMQVVVTSQYGSPWNSVWTTVANTRLVVVNERTSAVARGWTIAGLQHLYLQSDSSALITDGAGSAGYFTHSAPGTWTAPAGDFTSLRLIGTSLVRAYRDSTKLTFDASGRETQVADRFGNTTTFAYDGSSRLIQVRDPLYVANTDTLYRRLTLAYGSNGVSTVTDGLGRVTTVTVNSTKQLTQVTDPGGGTTKYKYDSALRLDTIVDRDAKAWPLGYDAYWRIDTVAGPSVPINGGSSARPRTRLVSWQEAGVPLSSTTTNAATAPRIDSIHAQVLDPEGNVTLYTSDRWGQPVAATNPIGQVTTTLRNGSGQVVRITSPQGAVDSLGYDATGFLVYSRHGSDDAITYANGGWGESSTINYTAYQETYSLASGTGAVTLVRGSAGDTVARYTYDTRGRATLYQDASGHTHHYGYDAQVGQRIADTLPDTLVTQNLYDLYGRDTATIVGSLKPQITHYDLLNRVTARYDSAGATPWTFTYDSLRPTQLSNPRGLVRTTLYNAAGWADSSWNSVQGSTVLNRTNYDKDGRVTSAINRRGQTINVAYDSLGRRTRMWTATHADTTTFNDAARTFTNSNGVVTETAYLNTLLRPDSAVWVFADSLHHRFKKQYHYATSGVVDSVIPTASGDTISLWTRGYAYTGFAGHGYLLSRVKFGSHTTTYTTTLGRDTKSRRVVVDTLSVPYPGGGGVAPCTDGYCLTVRVGHNVLQVIDSQWISDTALNRAAGRDYGLDSLGRITLEREAVDTNTRRTFAYDATGRLDSVGYYGAGPQLCYTDSLMGWKCSQNGSMLDSTLTYSYDAQGNRTDHSGTADVLDRLQSFGGFSFTYDADGNDSIKTGNGQTDTYYWSAEGLLDSVVAGSTHYGYRYDASGRLVQRLNGGALDRLFLWDGDQLMAEFRYVAGGHLTLVAEYSYYGADQPHAVRTAGDSVRYFGTDRLGSVNGLTNALGWAATLHYDPWGVTEQASGVAGDTIRPRWKGAFAEPATGLYYLRNRWYDPSIGRFLSEDPIGLNGGGNAYAFAGDDPVNTRDPSGTCDEAPPIGQAGGVAPLGRSGGVNECNFPQEDRHSTNEDTPDCSDTRCFENPDECGPDCQNVDVSRCQSDGVCTTSECQISFGSSVCTTTIGPLTLEQADALNEEFGVIRDIRAALDGMTLGLLCFECSYGSALVAGTVGGFVLGLPEQPFYPGDTITIEVSTGTTFSQMGGWSEETCTIARPNGQHIVC
ncbi:MAG TPA: RHS repeat-associated core domain-containing protein [Gemmatimonadales bacterium]|nr:RHS repeat-associated core domain-containing protein [Gemmatimonadales bacterium]